MKKAGKAMSTIIMALMKIIAKLIIMLSAILIYKNK
jgi:hypothetical protein